MQVFKSMDTIFHCVFLLSVRTPSKDKTHACIKETLKTQTKVLEAVPLEVLPERFVAMHPQISTRRSLTPEVTNIELQREMSPEIIWKERFSIALPDSFLIYLTFTVKNR